MGGTNFMKVKIFYGLAYWRDKDWMPEFMVRLIDEIRYDFFWEDWWD